MRRFVRVSGTPYRIGVVLGREARGILSDRIDRYLAEGPMRFAVIDQDRLKRDTLPWFEGLAPRFRDEMIGLSDGSGVPLRKIAEWTYVEACHHNGCSSFLLRTPNGETWIGRNNDLWAPDGWGYATVRDHVSRIPTFTFGMAAEPFTATGVNRARLWLHYHFLPPLEPFDESAAFEFHWLTDALETCETLADASERLIEVPRRSSMMLFAVDGKTNERGVFVCEPSSHVRWDDTDVWIAGTNHRRTTSSPAAESIARLERLEARLAEVTQMNRIDPVSLIGILADKGIEQVRDGYGTVYSNLARPSTGETWFTFGGFPAASRGCWTSIDWPWS